MVLILANGVSQQVGTAGIAEVLVFTIALSSRSSTAFTRCGHKLYLNPLEKLFTR